jgi:hypothetical protein
MHPHRMPDAKAFRGPGVRVSPYRRMVVIFVADPALWTQLRPAGP